MKEIVTYRHGSFKDFKGVEHKVVVCAISRRVNTSNSELFTSSMNIGSYNDCYHYLPEKILSFGVAVCNPIDNYNEEHGEMIAYNKAKSPSAPTLTSDRTGFFNTSTVGFLLNNYLEYIERDPGSVIPGYDEAKRKHQTACDLKDDISKMDDVMKAKIRILAESTPESIEYAKKVVKYIK